MALGARRQAALYYARKRRRDAVVGPPRLFGTADVLSGQSRSVFDANDYNVSVSFAAQVDLSKAGVIFSQGDTIALTQDATQISFTYRGVTIRAPKPPTGKWNVLVAIRMDGEMRLWTPVPPVQRGKAAAGAWGTAGQSLTASGGAVGRVRAFACQLPRRFFGATVQQQGVDELLYNTTAIFMNPGFQTPAFEDGRQTGTGNTDNTLYNTTLIGFLSGFQTPGFENGGS